MNRLCPTYINCICDDSGVLNTSSEAPDPLIFTGIGYTPNYVDRPPVLGPIESLAVAQDCYGVSFSVQSQEIADLLAEINAQFCVTSGGGAGGTPLTPGIAPSRTTPGNRLSIRGGGGGGGGGGESQTPVAPIGGTAPTMKPLHAWCCPEDELVAVENSYTVPNSRAGVDYVFSIASGSLPDGITLKKVSMNTAGLDGMPDADVIGKFNFVVQAEIPATENTPRFIVGTVSDTFEVLGFTNGDVIPEIPRGAPFSFQLTAYGTAPLTFTALDDQWPNGISLGADGEISGTATNADCGKIFQPIVAFADASGRGCQAQIELDVQGLIFLNRPPNGTLCAVYKDPSTGLDFQFLTDPPATEFSGTVPCGLTLDSVTGVVSGTLKGENGLFNVSAKADSVTYGEECHGELLYGIEITNPDDCANQIKDLNWAATIASGIVGHNMDGGSGSINLSSVGYILPACSNGTTSTIQVRSGKLKNCGAAYSGTINISWDPVPYACTQVPPYGSGTYHNYGSISVISGAGNFTNWSINWIPSVGISAGTHSIPYNLGASVPCPGSYFAAISVSLTGGGSLTVSVDIVPDSNPADCT